MDKLQILARYTIGDLTAMFAYCNPDQTLDSVLEDLDLDEDDFEEDETVKYNDEWDGWDLDEDESGASESENGAYPLDYDNERLAESLADDIIKGLYNMDVVEGLYPGEDILLDRVLYLVLKEHGAY